MTARLRQLPAILAASALLLVSAADAQDSEPTQLRVGYQKGSVSLVLAKSHQLLEKQFPNTKISWVEFPAGPQMLEALNVGSIDLGGTGDIPPIFAQAEVILVREDSPVKTVADLKGRKVAFQKGSSAHNTLLRALQRDGLKFTDIKPTYLTPADARAAFQQGNVDAWAIWDPYYSAALLEGGVRVLIDSSGLEKTGSFYLAGRPYAEAHGTFIRQVLDVLTKADALTISDRAQSVTLLANAVGLPEKVIETALDHRPPTTVEPLDAATIKAQQSTADLFYENRLVPVKVNIAERVWRPQAN
ncbi:sulfonate ABC transporter substrate-binding protein [Pectobacterium brasiliense]|nr:sulfonate ABC transporter substrate-binding protein [Pectobacterium brasiliense]